MALAALGLVCAALLAFQINLQIDNRRYAAQVFNGVVPYDRVIASRRWHPLFQTGGYNCIYAVVELDDAAPASPPVTDNTTSQPNRSGAWWLKYTGHWQQTPVADDADNIDIPDTTPGYQCNPYPGDHLVALLLRATDMPGGWYHRDGGTLAVYSKPAGVAFRFRFGD